MRDRRFEDWRVGDELETGSVTVSRESALAFAREYDPQPFHLDDAAAERSIFRRLAASGWQTASYAMRLVVDTGIFASGGVGLGIDDLRWVAPVYPGDTLTVRCTCLETTADAAKPTGRVRVENVVRNQDGTTVLRFTSLSLIEKRAAAG